MVSFGHDSKVFNPVVINNSVDMVDNFIGGEISADTSFNNKPVFHNAVSLVFVGMMVGISHNISPIAGDKAWVKMVGEFEPVPPGYLSEVICTKPNKLSGHLGAYAGISHVPDNIYGDISMVPVCPGDAELLHVDEDELFGNPILLGDSEHGPEFSVISLKSFFSDEQFSFHGTTISPYSLMLREKASRYSQDLQETARRGDKEPLDNIPEIKDQGDKIYIRTVPTLTINDYQKGQKLVYERPESDAIEMTIDYGKYQARYLC